MKKPGTRKTLADVAREAGVSVQTASHVMAENMTVRLSAATRAKVKAAAEKVGYRPNLLARAMRRGNSQVIGVWMPIDRVVLTHVRFLQAINMRSRAAGYEIMVTGVDSSLAYSGAGNAPRIWPVDGLIAVDAGKALTAFRSDPGNDATPIAVLGFEEFENADTIAWDVAGAAQKVTELMIQRGAKRIVHVTLDWVLRDYPREQRRRGYTTAMTEAGLEPIVIGVPGETSSITETSILEYLNDHSVPDAFFGFTDTLAIGVGRALSTLQVDIPNDCMIWGFGDTPAAEDYRVPISTIRTPIEELVDVGWDWLMKRIEKPNEIRRNALLAMELIERTSSRR